MAEGQTCDGCAYWQRPYGLKLPESVQQLTGVSETLLGKCSCPKFILGYHANDLAAMPDGVRVEDDEGWGFATGPKFGCVHWVKAVLRED